MCSAVGVQEVCKGDKSLEDEEHSGQPLEVDNDQLRAISKADPLTTTWEVDKELSVDHSMVISIWSKLERWKGSISECLMSGSKKKTKNKNPSLEVSSSQTRTQQQWTISQLVCDMPWKVDFIWQPVQLLDWEEFPKHFLKPNLH